MIQVLFEQFWTIAIIGTILTAVTIYGWLQTGNGYALKSAIGLAILTLLLLVINTLVITDGEVLRKQIYEMASELERNDRAKIRSRIHPHPTEIVRSLSNQMDSIEFRSVRVTRIHGIEFGSSRLVDRAVVRFNVALEADSRGMSGKVLRWVQLTFNKTDGKWLVSDFEEKEPQHEFLNSTHLERLKNQ